MCTLTPCVACRRAGDFANNDDVYTAMDDASQQAQQAQRQAAAGGKGGDGGGDERLDLDKERVVRTPQDMAAEAAQLGKAGEALGGGQVIVAEDKAAATGKPGKGLGERGVVAGVADQPEAWKG